MNISLLKYPSDYDWICVKQRALVTIGKKPINNPELSWKKAILEARHSPIRYLQFSFYLEDIPYYTSVHLCRHVHSQPYVRSQRNDRQNDYDRESAPQSSPVNMIWDMNAEELLTISNKRLCNLADPKTRSIVQIMCNLVEEKCPEFSGLLAPMCVYHNGKCHEIFPCKEGEIGALQNATNQL